MKFGKLEDISDVNFNLPVDPSTNEQIFENFLVDKALPKVYIGCTGWSMKEWVGTVYPKNTKSKDYLFQYAKQFNTIELNTTHYRIPNEKTIEKWKTETNEDFRELCLHFAECQESDLWADDSKLVHVTPKAGGISIHHCLMLQMVPAVSWRCLLPPVALTGKVPQSILKPGSCTYHPEQLWL